MERINEKIPWVPENKKTAITIIAPENKDKNFESFSERNFAAFRAIINAQRAPMPAAKSIAKEPIRKDSGVKNIFPARAEIEPFLDLLRAKSIAKEKKKFETLTEPSIER